MSTNKTKPTTRSVELFLDDLIPEQRKKDSWTLYRLMEKITGSQGVLWGTSIIGFGDYHYKYASGREGDWFLTGFSPRKNALTLYLMCDISHESIDFSTLGKHKKGKGCLYIKRLDDVDLKALENIIKTSISLTVKKDQ
ncbi:DUF1801 domain-containing protein [Flavobacteriaceae bacterium]|nr:DUF1801 domain-containing protein [Flavobacteriaceae bacterium]